MRQFENTFLFYLLDSSGRYYRFNYDTGIVDTTPTPTYLQDVEGDPQAPDGGKKTILRYTRSTKYWGLWRAESEPYIFYDGAHEIIKHIWLTEGVDGYCKLVLKRRDMANLSPAVTLDTFAEGHLDFSQCEPTYLSTSIPILQGGVRDKFSAYENTDFSIPIESFDSTNIYMDGISLFDTLKYTHVQTGLFSVDPIVPGANEVYIPLVFLSQEGTIDVGDTPDPNPIFAGTSNYGSNYFFRSHRTQTITVNLDGWFYYELPGAANDSIRLSIRAYVFSSITTTTTPLNGAITNLGVVNANTIWIDGADLVPGDSRDVHVQTSWTYTLTEGNIICLVAKAYHPNTPMNTSNWGFMAKNPPNAAYTLTTEFQLPAQLIPHYTIQQLFSKLVDKVSDGTATPVSTFFGGITERVDNLPFYTYVTSGTALRGISEPKIKTSFADYWRDMNAQYCLGLYVDAGQIRLEELGYFLDDSTETYAIDVEVSNLQPKVFTEALYSTIKVGYQNQEYNGLNGRYEVNNISTYKLPVSRAVATMDLQGAYRYDPVGAELFRADLKDRDSVDDRADDDIFITEAEYSGGFYFPRRKQNIGANYANDEQPQVTTTGAFWTRYYNISFTPARKLLRNAPHVLAATHLKSGIIEYLTSDKNENFYSDLGSGLITENASISTTDVIWGDPLYLPIVFEFDCHLPIYLKTAIEANPKGYISFPYRGYTFKGFALDIEYRVDEDVQTVRLLASPTTNLDDLKKALSVWL